MQLPKSLVKTDGSRRGTIIDIATDALPVA
jgi:hypothetical protein